MEKEQAEAMQAQGQEIMQRNNSRLRYSEQLHLNLKGYTSAFKSVTRAKRDNTLAGFPGPGSATEKTPAVGHYNPKLDFTTR